MADLKVLYERKFHSKPLKSFKVYEDPFGESQMCVELTFANGEVEYMYIGSGKPEIVSQGLCREIYEDA